MTEILPPPVRSYLKAYVARERNVELLRNIGWTIVIGLTWLLLICVTDHLFHLSQWIRGSLLVGGLLIALVGIVESFRRSILRPIDWPAVAAGIDTRLATITSQYSDSPLHRGSEQLLQAIVTDLEPDLRSASPARLIRATPAVWAWIAFMVIFAIFAAIWSVPSFDFRQTLIRVIKPWQDLQPASTPLVMDQIGSKNPQPETSDHATNAQENVSPEYEDSLQAYFEAISRSSPPMPSK